MIVDVWFQPWLAGGTRARAVDEVHCGSSGRALGDALGNWKLWLHANRRRRRGRYAARARRSPPSRWDGMGHKDQPGLLCSFPKRLERPK